MIHFMTFFSRKKTEILTAEECMSAAAPNQLSDDVMGVQRETQTDGQTLGSNVSRTLSVCVCV